MDSPDLQRAMAQGVHFFWLLEILPGNGGNAFANQIILQSDKPYGIWFAPNGALASWRPGWWRISQQPEAISIRFAWRDLYPHFVCKAFAIWRMQAVAI